MCVTKCVCDKVVCVTKCSVKCVWTKCGDKVYVDKVCVCDKVCVTKCVCDKVCVKFVTKCV